MMTSTYEYNTIFNLSKPLMSGNLIQPVIHAPSPVMMAADSIKHSKTGLFFKVSISYTHTVQTIKCFVFRPRDFVSQTFDFKQTT